MDGVEPNHLMMRVERKEKEGRQEVKKIMNMTNNVEPCELEQFWYFGNQKWQFRRIFWQPQGR